MGKTKFGIYIPKDLLVKLDECMRSLNINNRSKIVQEALQLFLLEHGWKTDHKVKGIIGVVYRHGKCDMVLTEIQHEYLEIIISTIHIHLDKERCMLAIIVDGDGDRIRNLISEIMNIKGVKIVRPLILSLATNNTFYKNFIEEKSK